MVRISNMNDSMFSLNGAASGDDVGAFRRDLEALIDSRSGTNLCLDVSGLESVNSVILSVFLCGLRRAENVSCDLSFANIPSKLFDVIRVGGLESIISKA